MEDQGKYVVTADDKSCSAYLTITGTHVLRYFKEPTTYFIFDFNFRKEAELLLHSETPQEDERQAEERVGP
jgi:hypothetical protein